MADKKLKPNCSFVDGIGSTTAIDTAGEIVDLAGIDCSSLIGGALNWEHQSNLPAQIVGKIIEYKKIFSEADCENDRHKHYWDICKTPYLYVMGRLFDDKKDSSKEVAALFLDDSEHPNEHPMVGFSIEGSKVDKKGIIVTKSIARKMTITNAPANKQCVAELIPAEPAKPDADSLFAKSEPFLTIELFDKSEKLEKAQVPGSKYPTAAQAKMSPKPASTGMKYGPIGPSAPKNMGKEIGKTKSGKSVMSHAKPTDYKDFSSQDHSDAATLHMGHAEEGKGVPGASHFDSAKRHMGLAGRNERQDAKAKESRQQALNRPDLNVERMGKSLTAGSGMASPGNLVQGAALGKEGLDKKMKKATWLARAEQEYVNWAKREEFEAFMSKSMPHLAKGQIKAIGQALCLNKSLKNEKKLKKMMAQPSLNSWIDKKEKK